MNSTYRHGKSMAVVVSAELHHRAKKRLVVVSGTDSYRDRLKSEFEKRIGGVTSIYVRFKSMEHEPLMGARS